VWQETEASGGPRRASRADASVSTSTSARPRGERKGLKVSVSFRDGPTAVRLAGVVSSSPKNDRLPAARGQMADKVEQDGESATTPLIGKEKRHPLAQIVCHRDENDAATVETSCAGGGSGGSDGFGHADCSHSESGSSDSDSDGGYIDAEHGTAALDKVGLVEASRRKLEREACKLEQARPLGGGHRPVSTPKAVARPLSGIVTSSAL
jgi:hypothetical protein